MNEPRQMAPIVLFGNRPGIGGGRMTDFRPRPVSSEDVLPVASVPALPVPPAEELDPKANSSATASATSSGIDSDETTTPPQTIGQWPAGVSYVSVATGTLPETLTIPPGSNRPPVGATGPIAPVEPLSSETPSSLGEGKP